MKDILTIDFLSEVLGLKVWKVLDCNMNTLRYCIYPNKGDEPSEYMFPININDLMDRCIEKYKSEYTFGVFTDKDSYWCNIWKYGTEDNARPFLGNTKIESVIKACQYIYNIKKDLK